MQIDSCTKAVLTVFAISLALIAVNPWIGPKAAEPSKHENVVAAIFGTLSKIANGTCKNTKICQSK